jgi:hypothetical protein
VKTGLTAGSRPAQLVPAMIDDECWMTPLGAEMADVRRYARCVDVSPDGADVEAFARLRERA